MNHSLLPFNLRMISYGGVLKGAVADLCRRLYNRVTDRTVSDCAALSDTDSRSDGAVGEGDVLTHVDRRNDDGAVKLVLIGCMPLLLQDNSGGLQPGRKGAAVEPLVNSCFAECLAIFQHAVQRICQLILSAVPCQVVVQQVLDLLPQVLSTLEIVDSEIGRASGRQRV